MPIRRVKLTQAEIEKLRPTERRYVVNDTQITGFRLFVYPSGKKTFHLRYIVNGGRAGTIREPKIGSWPTLKAERARQIASDWAAKVRLGEDPAADRQAAREAPTMDDLFARFMSDHSIPRKKPSSVSDDESLIRVHLAPVFGRRRVADITRADIDKFHKSKAANPYRANRCLALLSKAFNLAEVWGWRPDYSNPVRHVSKFHEVKRRRYLSPVEFRALGAALLKAERGELSKPITPYVIAAIRLLAFTGARRGEILGLQWRWIDWENGRAHLPDSKTGPKTLPLNGPALEILSSLPREEDNPFVIVGGKPGSHLVNLKDPWDLIRKEAGLEDFRIHDLRHSFASVGVTGGLGLPIIGAMLGHTQTQTTARYAHLADDPIRAASERVAREVLAAMNETAERTA